MRPLTLPERWIIGTQQSVSVNVDQSGKVSQLPDRRLNLVPMFALTLILCSITIGCGSSESVYPVRGSVYCNNEPAEGAIVHFHPLDRGKKQASPAFATVMFDGTYELTTFKDGDGAKAGEYAVTVNWHETSVEQDELIVGPDKLGNQYSNPAKSGLRYEVVRGQNEVSRFDVVKPQEKPAKQVVDNGTRK